MVEEMLYNIDDEEAIHIVKNMKPYGEAFSMQEVKDILTKLQIPHEERIEYYLCMNMFYNDYKTYVESKRLDMRDFCIEMSKLFINDIDVPKHKVEKYFSEFKEN